VTPLEWDDVNAHQNLLETMKTRDCREAVPKNSTIFRQEGGSKDGYPGRSQKIQEDYVRCESLLVVTFGGREQYGSHQRLPRSWCCMMGTRSVRTVGSTSSSE